jgi:methylmalonyl-CoA mutase cobalamin-binding subunit
MEGAVRRTPEASLKQTFLLAAAGLPEEDPRASVVAEALEYLQLGFDAHYAAHGATDDDILVGDNSYALSVETIARLDEPRFVAVASRMIRDGAGRIAAGGAVTMETWTPHLAGLLDIISGEGAGRSEERIRRAARELGDRRG